MCWNRWKTAEEAGTTTAQSPTIKWEITRLLSTMRKQPALSNRTTRITARCLISFRAVRIGTSSAAHAMAAIRRCRAATTVGRFAEQCSAQAFVAAAAASAFRFYAACRAPRRARKRPHIKLADGMPHRRLGAAGGLAQSGVFGLVQSGVARLTLRSPAWRV